MFKSKNRYEKVWSDMLHSDPQIILQKTGLSSSFAEECYKVFLSNITPNMSRVLEVGCGTGRNLIALAQHFPQLNCEGTDISPDSVALATQGAVLRGIANAKDNSLSIPNGSRVVDFYCDNALDLHPHHKEYDAVFSEGCVSMFNKDDAYKALQGFCAITKPGGKIMVGVPNQRFWIHTIHKFCNGPFYMYGYEKSYRAETLKTMFESYGLTNVSVTGIGFAHGCARYGSPFSLIAEWWKKLELTDPKRANAINNKYGFYLIAVGTR